MLKKWNSLIYFCINNFTVLWHNCAIMNEWINEVVTYIPPFNRSVTWSQSGSSSCDSSDSNLVLNTDCFVWLHNICLIIQKLYPDSDFPIETMTWRAVPVLAQTITAELIRPSIVNRNAINATVVGWVALIREITPVRVHWTIFRF